MLSRGRRGSRADAGFTLIELLISISILGVLMVAITGAMVVSLKANKETDTRLVESRDLQFVSTWFGDDVQSANRIAAGGPANCGTDPSGKVVLRFANTDIPTPPAVPPTSTPDTLTITYAVRTAAGGATELHRVACGSAGTTDVVVARSLSAAPSVTCLPSPCANARRVTLTLTELSSATATPLTYTLQGTRRSS